MAIYTVERFSINQAGGLRSRHGTLASADSAYAAAVKWFDQHPEQGVAWVNLVSMDTRSRQRYLRHWERKA